MSKIFNILKATVNEWIKKFENGEEFKERGCAHNVKLNREKKIFLLNTMDPGFAINTFG